MKYYRLYIKDEEGQTLIHLFNEVEGQHPLAQARRIIKGFYRGHKNWTMPEFKKLGEDRWRLNGVHRHPMFAATEGVWYVEAD